MKLKHLLICVAVTVPMLAASTKEDFNKRLRESASVLDEIMTAGDRGIPQDLLQRAQCVGVVPNLKRAGFIVGGEYGKGVLTCRTRSGERWSAPSTIRIEGGSIGLQIGAGETDVVLIVMNQEGMNKLDQDKFTVGGDASVMAGPVGRTANAETDAQLHAEILAYSRSRGVFAGVSLQGATLRPDKEDNENIYGEHVTQTELLHGRMMPTAEARVLFAELNKWAPYKG